MATMTIEEELVELENQYWQAIKDQDLDTALRLTDNPCIVAGAQGVASLPREGFEKMMKSSAWTLNDFEFVGDVVARQLTDDVAVVGYKVREQLTVEGKPLTLEAAEASTWVRRGGRWLCALHTESLTGDPFGRDRRAIPQSNR